MTLAFVAYLYMARLEPLLLCLRRIHLPDAVEKHPYGGFRGSQDDTLVPMP